MADWTAITGILVSGVVGPVAGAGGAYLLLKRQQRHSDRAAALVLLDEAAVALARLEKLMHSRATRIRRDDDFPDGLVDRYNEAGRTVEEFAVRLGVRLGDTGPSRTYLEAQSRLSGLDDAINTFAQTATNWEEVRAARTAASTAQSEFLRAANAAVGLTIR